MYQLIRSTLSLVTYFFAIWFAYEVYGWTLPVIILLFLIANNLERSVRLNNALKGIQRNFTQIKCQLNENDSDNQEKEASQTAD